MGFLVCPYSLFEKKGLYRQNPTFAIIGFPLCPYGLFEKKPISAKPNFCHYRLSIMPIWPFSWQRMPIEKKKPISAKFTICYYRPANMPIWPF